MKLSTREYAVLQSIRELIADCGTSVSKDAISGALAGTEAKELSRSLKSLEELKFIDLDDEGRAEITDQGIAALASL